MRKIVFTFNLVLLIFFVISCQDKRVEEVPISSDEHFPQVYFLKDKSIDCDFSISFDSLRSLEKKLKLKFHFKVVETKEQFLETLKRWNARPIDFLFVLTNRFVEDFTSLRLVKKPNLRQYLISDSQALKITSDIKSLLLNEEDLKSFEKFYLKNFGNKIYRDNSQCDKEPLKHDREIIMSIGKRNESAFSMMLNWESILTDLVKRKIELNEPVLSLKNNYLSFYANEHNAVVQKNLEKIKLWALGRLN